MKRISEINTSLTEEYLRHEPEGTFLERKGRDVSHTKLANELIGMLNAGGGVIIYGIADDGTVESLAETELIKDTSVDLDKYRKVVHDFIKPPSNIQLEEVYLSEGELVFIFHVEPSFEGVYQRQDNEAVYLRVADSNKGPLNRGEVTKLEYNRGTRNYEEEIISDFQEEDLDEGYCAEYLKVMNFKGSFQELAYKRHLVTKVGDTYQYKRAAILLFAKDPERYIPNAGVRYLRYEGDKQESGSDFNAVKDTRFEGCIPKLIKDISAFLEASLNDYYFLNIEEGRFNKIPEYPKGAWLEGIVNALYHRSYNIQGRPTQIKHFSDRLEISNSGPLPAQVTVENIRDEQFTRNVRIARTLNELGYVKELNEGVKRIYKVMEELRLETPVYSQQNNYVYLTLKNEVAGHESSISDTVMYFIEKNWKNFNKTQQGIITILISFQPEVSLDDFVKLMNISEQAIRKNLNILLEKEVIEKMTTKERDRNAPYRLNSN